MLSVFTPDVVCSGFVASFDISLGGKSLMVCGCAMRDSTWLAKSNLWGLFSSFFRGFSFFVEMYLVDHLL